jgi:hypothetical protein
MRASANRDGIRIVTDETKETGDRPSEPEAGVFAKLPDTRPGSRSPRRRADARAAQTEGELPEASPPAAAAKPAPPKPPPARTPPSERAAEPQPGAEPSSGSGLEDVAWAGIAVAAEAATLGVRLASRAIESLRGNPGRR